VQDGRDPLGGLFLRFLGFGARAWGGPAAQIAMLREELVDRDGWMGRDEFNRTLAVYQALPGPEATELCVHFGMLRRGRWGAVLAGLGFLLPGLVAMLALSWLYVAFGWNAAGAALLVGLQPAVAALVLRATVRIADHALSTWFLAFVAAASLLATLLDAPFWATLPVAGIASLAWRQQWRWPALGLVAAGLIAAVAVPVAAPTLVLDDGPAGEAGLLDLSWSGLKAGLLTFGGAYTAIPFLHEDSVGAGGWVTAREFTDGIALSGLLPAPLVIFGTFLGWLGGGLPGALLLTAGIFLPAFAFTLVGYPLFARLVAMPRLHAFLDGVTAGVVGLIAVTALGLVAVGVTDLLRLTVFLFAAAALWSLSGRWTVPLVVAASAAGGWLLVQAAA
jgi:chromate transporter